MDKSFMRGIEKFRTFRTKKLEPIGKVFFSIGLNANRTTFLSLLSGLAAIYYLFNNHLLFVIFAALHLFLDSMDGVIARLHGSGKYGPYYDTITDSLITILALVKVGWFVQDIYAYIVAGLFTLAVLIHLASRLQAPMVFMRTATLVLLSIFTIPNLFTVTLLTIGYLIAGVFSLFSLARQLQWILARQH